MQGHLTNCDCDLCRMHVQSVTLTNANGPAVPIGVVRIMPPSHPYWCDDCGRFSGFRIAGCPIPHVKGCPRYGEDAMVVYKQAVVYVQTTKQTIP